MGLDRLKIKDREEESKVIPRFPAWTTGWRSNIFKREDHDLGLDIKI